MNNKKYAVSVIIPIYNVEHFLPRCLDSVKNQTLKNIEIICINDGSPDNCAEILQKYVKDDSRFNIITQQNQGLSASRNKGIALATGEYVFFLDADDYIHPQTLEIFYKTAKKSKSEVVISTKVCRLAKDPLPKAKYNVDYVKFSISLNPIDDLYKYRLVSAVVWNKLYRTEMIKKFRFIEGIYFEDWPFTTCVFSSIKDFAYINESLYIYNTMSASIVRSKFSIKKIHDYIYGIRYIYDYFHQNNRLKQWEIIRKKRISCSLKMVLSKITKSTENLDELEKYFKQEYKKLTAEKVIYFSDLSLKSKFRLIRLLWRQRDKTDKN